MPSWVNTVGWFPLGSSSQMEGGFTTAEVQSLDGIPYSQRLTALASLSKAFLLRLQKVVLSQSLHACCRILGMSALGFPVGCCSTRGIWFKTGKSPYLG